MNAPAPVELAATAALAERRLQDNGLQIAFVSALQDAVERWNDGQFQIFCESLSPRVRVFLSYCFGAVPRLRDAALTGDLSGEEFNSLNLDLRWRVEAMQEAAAANAAKWNPRRQ
jgi:hypothetical protein